MKKHVIVIEDDRLISEVLSEKLRREGFKVSPFTAAEEVLELPKQGWDIVVLDIMLAGEMSGLQLCERLRGEQPHLPVLILSALSEPLDRVEGLKMGADDYLIKPFEMEELLLRVNAMLRRSAWYHEKTAAEREYFWEDCRVHFGKLEGRKKEKVFHLSPKECMIFKLLIEKNGEVVSRDEILDKVWGYDVYPSSRTVDNFIVRLRKYFDSPERPRFFHSVRGLGYRFTPKESKYETNVD